MADPVEIAPTKRVGTVVPAKELATLPQQSQSPGVMVIDVIFIAVAVVAATADPRGIFDEINCPTFGDDADAPDVSPGI